MLTKLALALALLGAAAVPLPTGKGGGSPLSEVAESQVTKSVDVSHCTNTDGDANDTDGEGCDKYESSWCGTNYDDEDFEANIMCCVCGGGAYPPPSAPPPSASPPPPGHLINEEEYQGLKRLLKYLKFSVPVPNGKPNKLSIGGGTPDEHMEIEVAGGNRLWAKGGLWVNEELRFGGYSGTYGPDAMWMRTGGVMGPNTIEANAEIMLQPNAKITDRDHRVLLENAPSPPYSPW